VVHQRTGTVELCEMLPASSYLTLTFQQIHLHYVKQNRYDTSVDLPIVSATIFEVVIHVPLHSILVDSFKMNGTHSCTHMLSLPLSLCNCMYVWWVLD
jgi:hypothetical protein